jgi:RNA polymerase sigma-70 factor (ECF subfamily)
VRCRSTRSSGRSSRTRAGGPEEEAEQSEALALLAEAIETVLTPHQRTVFLALALNEVPIDILAESLGTTRNALYKTLHDARRKLRAHLIADEES